MSRDEDNAPLISKVGGGVQDFESALEIEARGCRKAVRGVFGEAKNATFALNAELAFRNAFCVTLLGIPFMIPAGRIDALDDFRETGLFTVGSIFFCVFNTGKSVGETIGAVSHGIKGAVLAVLHAWMLYAVFPHGVADDASSLAFVVGVADVTLVVGLALVLNINMSTKIFFISSTVGWSMAFLKPGDDKFHGPGSADWDPYRDTGLSCLVSTTAGAAFAVLATLMPYPMFAMGQAKEVAFALTPEVPKTWRLMVDYLSEEGANAYASDQVYRNMLRFDIMREPLAGFLDSAFWESCGLTSQVLVRRKLRRLDQAMAQGSESMHSLWGVVSQQDWSGDHFTMMKQIKPLLHKSVNNVESLMNSCCRASVKGKLTEAELSVLKTLVTEAKGNDEELARVVHRIRHNAGATSDMHGKNDVNKDLIERWLLPHVLAFNLSVFQTSIIDFAEDLVKGNVDSSSLPLADLIGGPADYFKGITEKENLNFALRAFLSIGSGYLLGFFGFEPLIQPYSPGIAVTCAFLLSKFVGSAIVKNLGRVQGVVLGTVLGQIIASIFNSCVWYSVVPLTFAAFLYAFFTFFLWHNGSQQMSFIGCLAASFGLSQLLSSNCTPVGEAPTVNKSGTFDSIVTNILSCIFVIIVDMCVGPKRAGCSAVEGIYDLFTYVDKSLGEHFDSNISEVPTHDESFRAIAGKVRGLGQHAANEPRIHRTPWKTDLWGYTSERLSHLRFNLRSLQNCMNEGFNAPGSKRNSLLQELLQTKSFPKIGAFLQKKVAVVRKLCSIFEHETTQRLPALADESVTQEFKSEAATLVNELVREMTDTLSMFNSTSAAAATTMKDDTFAQLCTLYGSMNGMMRDLRLIQHRILRES